MSQSYRGIRPIVRPESEEETLKRERDERIYFGVYTPPYCVSDLDSPLDLAEIRPGRIRCVPRNSWEISEPGHEAWKVGLVMGALAGLLLGFAVGRWV